MTATDRDTEFTDFVIGNASSLGHIAYLLTGDHHAADDLLQDALAKSWLAWHRINPATRRAYVRRAMVNLATDRWRRRRYATVPVEIDGNRPDPRSTSAYDAVEERDALVRQLTVLSARERAIVVLRYVEDLPVESVAELVGCSAGTVKSTCSRALARLRSRDGAATTTRSLP
ncbi:MAG: SigE family RNA polymerase sigma factor [Arachnia sp.]